MWNPLIDEVGNFRLLRGIKCTAVSMLLLTFSTCQSRSHRVGHNSPSLPERRSYVSSLFKPPFESKPPLVCLAHALLTSDYCCCSFWIEPPWRLELGCQVVFLTCFFPPFSVFSQSQSQINFEHSHSEHAHTTKKKSVILFSCRSHEKISSPKEQVRSSLSL